ncbi:H-type lectin domain-containing protein [Shimia marina]|uniref:H-type lectin domain protein n=1 Tax=Shimia marina TaxID=321267 RepID=A0A0P1EPL4_9RHOB|nr:H-type lectin domain-containing protein [Shimia marina]CUH52344.1 H-type lectin domain protein [Shimia marina]SFE09332.1 H-type lectin domain-containing protein [Shimia marina]
MKRIRNNHVGVDQGDEVLFSDFEDGGEMWTGNGPRERRKLVKFSARYRVPPSVHVSLSLWDMDTQANLRAEVVAEEVTNLGFHLVFRTWGDSRIARVRMSWLAIGELGFADDWVIED